MSWGKNPQIPWIRSPLSLLYDFRKERRKKKKEQKWGKAILIFITMV